MGSQELQVYPKPVRHDPESTPWRVRKATLADLDTIEENTAAFAREAGVGWFVREIAREGIRRTLEDPQRFGPFYLAETEQGEVAGQVMVSRIFNEWRNRWTWIVTSMFVVEKYR